MKQSERDEKREGLNTQGIAEQFSDVQTGDESLAEDCDDFEIAAYEELFDYEESYYDKWFQYPGQGFPCRT